MITALRFTRPLPALAFVFPLVCAQARAQPVPAGAEFEVTPAPSYKDSRPRVAADASGRFVVVWEFQDYYAATEGIKARRFDSDGMPLGGEFFVSTQPSYDERFPDVASGSSEFVVTWWERDPPSHGWRLMARRLDADAVPLGNEFIINVSAWFRNDRAKVAMDGGDRFVAVWWNAYVDGDQLGNGGGGVLARRYASDGSPLSSEFVVNETTAYVQLQPDVAMHPDGDFVVVWSNQMWPPPDYVQQKDIRGRRYDSSGAPLGGEVLVNDPASVPEGWPAPDATIDASGVPTISWPSLKTLDWPSQYHVVARQFEPFVCRPLPGRVTDLGVGWSAPGLDMSFTWTDTHDADSYFLFADGSPGGAFVNLKAAAYSAADGIILPVSSGTTYYLLAASNPACGMGALRLP
ncbi:MAG TPA: hypothetical protein VNI57_10390 [Candidatus Saccharimonadales bacterium]|nr:hypothetical protein [Candidatus Saccharimonadales bacterium]